MSINKKAFFPVEVLRVNMLRYVQTYLPHLSDEINDSVKFGVLDKFIVYKYTNKPISDVAEISKLASGNHRIGFYDNFLQFLWCTTYSFLVFYDQNYSKKNKGLFNEDEYNKGLAIFESGMGLFKTNTKEQFYKLPNPTMMDNDDPMGYISKASRIFLNAFTFILSHEFGHYYLGHCDEDIKLKTPDLLKQEEFKADEYALATLKVIDDPRFSWNMNFGIVTGISSLIFLNNSLKGGDQHPDTDDRIKNILTQLNLEVKDNLWDWTSLMFLFWSNHYGKPILLEHKFENPYQTFCYIYEKCQDRAYK